MNANPLSPFPYSDDNKRYHTFSYYLKHRFGKRVYKIPLDAGFTCPNIDGTKGVGGCIFCSPDGEYAGNGTLPLAEQYHLGIQRLSGDKDGCGFIPYLQSRTNTYAGLPVLKELYEAALSLPGAVGLCIATRPDALPAAVLDYLEELNSRTWLVIELGLQTIHDETASRINRCHGYEEFLLAYHALSQRGIQVCIHLINGLPGESRLQMLQTVKAVAALRPRFVKLHMLRVLKGTAMEQLYRSGQWTAMREEEYVGLVCDQLEYLPEETVIQRLTSDGRPGYLLAPAWTLHKRRVLNAVDREMAFRDSQQGKRF